MENDIKTAFERVDKKLSDLSDRAYAIESNLRRHDTKIFLLRLNFDFHEDSVSRRLNSIDTTLKILDDYQCTNDRKFSKLDDNLQSAIIDIDGVTEDIDNSRRNEITQKDALRNLEGYVNRKIMDAKTEAKDLVEQKLKGF